LPREKKSLKKTKELIKNEEINHPEKEVELWCQDEARLGLQPVIRYQWCVKGLKAEARQKLSFKWLYVYGFVNPCSGETF
jgi:hypothetical protein